MPITQRLRAAALRRLRLNKFFSAFYSSRALSSFLIKEEEKIC